MLDGTKVYYTGGTIITSIIITIITTNAITNVGKKAL